MVDTGKARKTPLYELAQVKTNSDSFSIEIQSNFPNVSICSEYIRNSPMLSHFIINLGYGDKVRCFWWEQVYLANKNFSFCHLGRIYCFSNKYKFYCFIG